MQGTPMLDAMKRAVLLVEREAKLYLKPWEAGGGVDTGLLRASITPEVRVSWNTVVGIVGSNRAYAPFVHEGTPPHWPPPGALERWARRHHMSEFVIRRAIATHGTRARPFLTDPLEEHADEIADILEKGVGKVANK